MQVDTWFTAPRAPKLAAVVGVVVLAAVGALVLWFSVLGPRLHQAQSAARGAQVMPFALERTTHRFNDLPDGGLQQVVADDPADAAQIALIRSHLQAETAKFQQGDFGAPAAIHGAAMPGLAALRAGYAQLAVVYAALPDGAQIRYTSSDPALVAALHAWFNAQRSDHGGHALEHGAP